MEKEYSRILIVDDNKDIHEDIKFILNSSATTIQDVETQSLKDELFGSEPETNQSRNLLYPVCYTIDDAYQGEEAIAMVQKAVDEDEPYSLIFMDVRMPPGMDGIQAIKKIWQIQPCVEVVICTAYSDYSWDQILSELGQNDHLLFIRKPFDHVSVKQISLSMTKKWKLQRQNEAYIENLESEVLKRTQELKNLVEKLTGEIKLREDKEKQLAYNAHYDSLTGLLNRSSFYQSISTVIQSDQDCHQPFSLFFIDIDGFKKVNDDLGHDVGDLLLIEISKRVRKVLAGYVCHIPDYLGGASETEAIFRLGGDEITAIIAEGSKEKTAKIATKLIENIRKPYLLSKNEVRVSCSIGISRYPFESTCPGTLLKYADIAMYKAKRVKGICIFHEELRHQQHNELRIENGLKYALRRKQVELHYQSLINPKNEVIGIQALVRWNHPELGVLKPEQFIHIAEETDQMIEIGEHILRTACKHLKEIHRAAGYEHLFVLVNCTAKQFYDAGFIEVVKDALSKAEVEPANLKIGLEEKFSIEANKLSLSIIHELSRIGIQFTLNGFTSAYPTFVFLQQMPQDTMLKISRAYVENIATDINSQSFLLSIMDVIKSLGLNVIVSGIETPEQRDIVNRANCIMQGYHFDTPKPLTELLQRLKSQ
ncbi:MAG: EAL domain-containing protein [Clostridia bacterium]|nr:EAL domain-containing protein [Clostridia bacterium]